MLIRYLISEGELVSNLTFQEHGSKFISVLCIRIQHVTVTLFLGKESYVSCFCIKIHLDYQLFYEAGRSYK